MHQKPNQEQSDTTAKTLKREILWFSKVLETRMRLYLRQENEVKSIYDIKPPNLEEDETLYGQMLRHYGFGVQERLVLLLAMMPHLKPEVLDIFFSKNQLYDRPFTEFGGVIGQAHRGFIPTGETVLFLLTGGNLTERLQALPLLSGEHPLQSHFILEWGEGHPGEPHLSRTVSISEEYLTYFLGEEFYQPAFSAQFPARLMTTSLKWEDLVLEKYVLDELHLIRIWLDREEELVAHQRIQPGYSALFYGASGTGKTLAVTLIGEEAGKEVYRVNLAQVISKYIGETEKNLKRLFDRAAQNDWILFFDEADALFGKRTDIKDIHDRYANQEVSYFFDCMHDFRGLCIVAFHSKNNVPEELVRHFQLVVHFPVPNAEQRLLLWKKAFDGQVKLANSVDLERVAQDYELNGAQINEVLRYCLLSAAQREENMVTLADVFTGVRAVLKRNGKFA